MTYKYFPELTLDQLNALITAASTRMAEKAELYEKCQKAGDLTGAQQLYGQYIALKGAKIQLENASYINIDTLKYETKEEE